MTPLQPGSDRTAPAPAQPGGRAELLPRVLSAIVMGAAALGTAVLGGPLFDLFWWLAAVAVLWEWHGLAGLSRRNPLVLLGGAPPPHMVLPHPA